MAARRNNWLGRLHDSRASIGGSRLGRLLVSLAALSVLGNIWDATRRTFLVWTPAASHQTATPQKGVAVSLKDLLRAGNDGVPSPPETRRAIQRAGYPMAGSRAGLLPLADLDCVIVDRTNADWILVGSEAAPTAGIPADAVAGAIQANHDSLEAPGVDIRPLPVGGLPNTQRVSYFGTGIKGSAMGAWFYHFDYWMKSAALSETLPLPGVPSYWQRAVGQVRTLTAQGAFHSARRSSRCWLYADRAELTEAGDVLLLDEAPLVVRAQTDSGPADALAEGFASDLTAKLSSLPTGVPISQIRVFSKLMNAISWLSRRDPYHALAGWSKWRYRPATTPGSVTGFVRSYPGASFTLTVSGGVCIRPNFRLTPGSAEASRALLRAVITARPEGTPVWWRFGGTPPARP